MRGSSPDNAVGALDLPISVEVAQDDAGNLRVKAIYLERTHRGPVKLQRQNGNSSDDRLFGVLEPLVRKILNDGVIAGPRYRLTILHETTSVQDQEALSLFGEAFASLPTATRNERG